MECEESVFHAENFLKNKEDSMEMDQNNTLSREEDSNEESCISKDSTLNNHSHIPEDSMNIDDSIVSTNLLGLSESFTPEDMIQNSSWELGQLAWARMSIYPFWPCMVTYDPNSMMIFQKVSYVGKAKTLMVHVHFFNDNGRHSWIPAHHMLPFSGIEDFRKRASLITDAIKKKEPKFAAALSVKPNIFDMWQKAVAEAMDVLEELDMSALDNFKPQAKDKVKKSKTTYKKRKLKGEDDKNIKRFKSIEPSNEDRLSTNSVDNAEIGNKIALETPPISPPNEEDLRAAVFQKQKRITKMINKLQPPDFEVYYERNFFTIKDENSDATDEQVREYLLHHWEAMAPEEKLKYRATYKIGDS